MKFRIETPGFKASPSLKEFVKEKAGSLDKFYKDLQEVEVTLLNEVKKTKEIVTCTINMRVPGKDEYVKASSEIFEDAILKAVEAAKRRLRIRKTQLHNALKKDAAKAKAERLKKTMQKIAAKKAAQAAEAPTAKTAAKKVATKKVAAKKTAVKKTAAKKAK